MKDGPAERDLRSANCAVLVILIGTPEYHVQNTTYAGLFSRED